MELLRRKERYKYGALTLLELGKKAKRCRGDDASHHTCRLFFGVAFTACLSFLFPSLKAIMASSGVQGLRPPMVSLRSEENIPLKRTPTKPAPKVLFKKREREQIDRERSDSPAKRIKATAEEAATQRGPHGEEQAAICHQCRHWVPKCLMLHCTRLKISSVSGVVVHCTKWYCNRCLLNSYGETVTSTTSRCAAEKDEWHFEVAGFIWACPACQGVCNCSVHRKRDMPAPMVCVPLGPSSRS